MIPDLKPVLLSAGFAVAAAASHAADSGLNGYDFSYAIAGDAKVTPIQVFDDGAQTYFQFKTTDNMPAIFLVDKGRQGLVQAVPRSPYVVVSGLGRRFALRSGAAVASVDYVGAKRNSAALPTARAAVEAATAAPAVELVPRAQTASQSDVDFDRLLAAIRKSIRSPAGTLPVNPAMRAARIPAAEYEAVQPYVETALPGFRTVGRRDVPFYRGHAKLGRLGSKAMDAMLEDARNADRVIVTGRPDLSQVADIAAARGNAIKAFLLSQGIPAGKIEIREAGVAKPSGTKDVFLSEVAFGSSTSGAGIRVKNEAIRQVDGSHAAREAKPAADLLPVFRATMTLLKQGKITQDAAATILGTVAEGNPGHADAAQPARLPAAKPVWEMSQADGTLRNTLSRWANASGWQLSWEIPFDYPITLGAQFRGSLEEAVASVATSLEAAEVPIQVTFYRANKVMRVLAGGGRNK